MKSWKNPSGPGSAPGKWRAPVTEEFFVEPGAVLRGRAAVPGDKSISHRAVILAALAHGTSRITGFLHSGDCLATLAAVEGLGAEVVRSPEGLSITGCNGRLRAPQKALDLGNSGTAMRLLAGVLAGQEFESTLTGDHSLNSRPMDRVIRPLTEMGAAFRSRGGRAPLTITGRRPLRPIRYEMPVASAQVKSAILLAGLFAEGQTTVIETAVTRDHTERMLAAMGAPVERNGRVVVLDGPAELQASNLCVPGDFSSAAFFISIAAGIPGSDLTLDGVGLNPTRTGLLDILAGMGADIRIENERVMGGEPVGDIHIAGRKLRGVAVDPRLVPLAIDEFPVLFVAAALAEGSTRVTGAAELRVKESDRLAAMATALAALGVNVSESDDGLTVHGTGEIGGGHVDCRGDHRVAMALALAASGASAPIVIVDVANVATSFPGFADFANRLGMQIAARAPLPENVDE